MTCVTKSATEAKVVKAEEAFSFTGNRSEYFRIWLTDTALTLITLGFYSAWAKVHRLRYFHRNTRIAGASFDYHGRPLPVLLERLAMLIVIGTFLVFPYLDALLNDPANAPSRLVLLPACALAFPCLRWLSLRRHLQRTSYRGVRFRFTGSLWGSYRVHLLWPIAALLSFGLAIPSAVAARQRYRYQHIALGSTRLQSKTTWLDFYKPSFVWSLVTVGVAFLLPSIAAGLSWLGDGITHVIHAVRAQGGYPPVGHYFVPYPHPYVIVLLYMMGSTLFFVLSSLFTLPLLKGVMMRVAYHDVQLSKHRTVCRLNGFRYAGRWYLDALLVIITLGLYRPIMQLRTARYVLSHIVLVPAAADDPSNESNETKPPATAPNRANLTPQPISTT